MNIPVRASLQEEGDGGSVCPSGVELAQVSPSGISQRALESPENEVFLSKATISQQRK